MISITRLTFDPNPIHIANSSISTGTVILSGPAPANATVMLTSSDIDTLNVPIGVRIPRGSTSTTFQVQGAVGPRAQLTVQVTATYTDSSKETSEVVASVTVIGLQIT
jgi:hypothetical protein